MAEVVWYILPILSEVCSEFHRLLAADGRMVLKQAFLLPGEQKYGNGIVSDPGDLWVFLEKAELKVEHQIILTESSGERVCLLVAAPR